MDDAERAAAAHVLRRATFGPFPGMVDQALDRHGSTDGILDALLAAPPVPLAPPAELDQPYRQSLEAQLGNDVLVQHWVDRMCDDAAGVHERMMWFWHNVFTTSAEKGTFLFLWKQLRTLHRHAMGNFGDLARAMVVDPSLMQYLDGDGSDIRSPNENLGRELIELFTLGRGNYSEDDVRAAARSLSGWQIDFETGVANFRPDHGPSKPDTFLGTTRVFTATTLVDRILEHPACAPFICRKLWRYFVGGPVDDAVVVAWADAFRTSGYEIAPIVETVLRSDAFARARHARARTGVEWFTAMRRAVRLRRYEVWQMAQLGQVPYYPPNVAGWPEDAAWLSPACQFARASFVATAEVDIPDLRGDVARAALEWCGLYDASDESRAALAGLARRVEGDRRDAVVLRGALMTPEFALA